MRNSGVWLIISMQKVKVKISLGCVPLVILGFVKSLQFSTSNCILFILLDCIAE